MAKIGEAVGLLVGLSVLGCGAATKTGEGDKEGVEQRHTWEVGVAKVSMADGNTFELKTKRDHNSCSYSSQENGKERLSFMAIFRDDAGTQLVAAVHDVGKAEAGRNGHPSVGEGSHVFRTADRNYDFTACLHDYSIGENGKFTGKATCSAQVYHPQTGQLLQSELEVKMEYYCTPRDLTTD